MSVDLRVAPHTFSVELNNLEREVMSRLDNLGAEFDASPDHARKALTALTAGERFRFEPHNGVYRVVGSVAVPGLLMAGTAPDRFASPAGFECGTPQIQAPDIAECSTIADPTDPSKSPQKDAGGQSGGEKEPAASPSGAPSGVTPERLDAALVAAVASATAAGEWDLVELLAAKLRARARARLGSNVVDLDAARRKRD